MQSRLPNAAASPRRQTPVNSENGEEEENVDVENCNEEQQRKRSNSPQTMSPKKHLTAESNGGKSSSSGKRARGLRSHANCEELRHVQCILETKDLWDKFHDLETEMIITKTGR